MNRLGERFQVDFQEGVVGPQEEWRLFLLAATDASAEAFSRRSLVFALSVGGALSWVVLILAGFYVVRKAMSPVQEIVNAVEHIRLSDLQKRLPATKARDELSRIASTINNMLDRLERAYRRERQFTGDASHELRGPLTKVLGEIELALSRERSAEEYRAALESCRRYAETMKALVESLITLARLDSGSKSLAETSLDLGDLAVETIGRFQPEESGSS
jgi:signal transduction histidine kinase